MKNSTNGMRVSLAIYFFGGAFVWEVVLAKCCMLEQNTFFLGGELFLGNPLSLAGGSAACLKVGPASSRNPGLASLAAVLLTSLRPKQFSLHWWLGAFFWGGFEPCRGI